PSLTRISLTMPPSKCCTLLRLPSTLITALATTAPFSGAVTAQVPMPPKKIAMISHPAIATWWMESLGPPSLGPPSLGATFGLTAARAGRPSSGMHWCAKPNKEIVNVQTRSNKGIVNVLPRRGLDRTNRHRPRQPRQRLVARPEHLNGAVTQDQHFLDNVERGRPMRNDHHACSALFQLLDAFGQRRVPLGVKV